jgi:chitin disaccharide deacetylase
VQKDEKKSDETAAPEVASADTPSKGGTVEFVFDPAPVKAAVDEFSAKPVVKPEPEPAAVVPTQKPAAPVPAPKPSGAPRRIWLVADDYGISPGVNDAIRELLLRNRINATSVMTAAPSFSRAEAVPLTILKAGVQTVAIGLHVTLTAPFRPLSAGYGPVKDGAFLPLKATLRAAMLRRLKPQKIAVEVGAQIKAFTGAFGRPPDFIDGHQHVHIFPQVREAVIAAVRHAAPNAWLRHCGSSGSFTKLFSDRKGWLINRLSGSLQKRAGYFGLATNPAFAGTYSFRDDADYPALFPKFLAGLPDGSVVMCHPGHVDDELKRLDTLTTLREKEYAFFAGDAFLAILERHGVTLG